MDKVWEQGLSDCGFGKIFLIGTGNVAWHVSTSLYAQGIRFAGIYNRTPAYAQKLAEKLHCPLILDLAEATKEAQFYFICTSDQAIAPVTASLPPNDGLVIHVSGSTSVNEIDPKHRRRGVFYPLQTFNKERRLDFKTIPVAVEALSENDTELLTRLALLISEIVLPLNEDQRRTLHVAAVYASNFTNFMYTLSAYILHKNCLDFKLLLPLIRETADRIENIPDPFSVQTGPAVRNDMETIRKHLDLLRREPELKEIYQIVTHAIEKWK